MTEDALMACVLPVQRALAAWPRVTVSAADAARLGRGQACIAPPGRPAGAVGLWLGERGLGIGRVEERGRLLRKRLFTLACVCDCTGVGQSERRSVGQACFT